MAEKTDRTDTLKIVQIGCGGRAQAHARAISQLPVDFAAVCDLMPERAEATAARFEVPKAYTEFERMMADERPDVVAFIAPPTVRRSVIVPVLKHRPRAVVIEKPMATSTTEAAELVAAAEEAGAHLIVCHECRYAEELIGLRQAIRDGHLGRLHKLLVHCKLNMMGQGTHMLDLVNMLLDQSGPRWTLAQVDGREDWRDAGGHDAPDHALIQMGYDGVNVIASIGHRSPDVPAQAGTVPLEFQLTAFGDDGIGIATLGHSFELWNAQGQRTFHRAPAFDHDTYMTRGLYEELLDVLTGDGAERSQRHAADAGRALAVHRTIEQAYASAAQHRAVSACHAPVEPAGERLRARQAAEQPLIVSSLLFGHRERQAMAEAVAGGGFEAIDLWMVPSMADHLDVASDDPRQVSEAFARLGLSVPMVSYYGQPPIPEKLQAAAAMGAKVAVTAGRAPDRLKDQRDALMPQLDLAASLGMRLAFENHVDTLETIEQMSELMDVLDHPAAAICLAPPHLHIVGQHAVQALAELRDRIAVLYLWDVDASVDRANMGAFWWERGEAQVPGASDLDFTALLAAAVRWAPQALWSLTWHGTDKWPTDTLIARLHQAAAHIHRCRPFGGTAAPAIEREAVPPAVDAPRAGN